MPTPPEGQWTIVAEGLGSGTLSIMSDAPNRITGTAFNRQLIGFFEQKAAIAGLSGLPQVPSGTITFVLDPNAVSLPPTITGRLTSKADSVDRSPAGGGPAGQGRASCG